MEKKYKGFDYNEVWWWQAWCNDGWSQPWNVSVVVMNYGGDKEEVGVVMVSNPPGAACIRKQL